MLVIQKRFYRNSFLLEELVLFELRRWSLNDQKYLIALCNGVDRKFLSDRIPEPYTKEDADIWLNMVSKTDGINNLFRAICVNKKIIGGISLEKKDGVYKKTAVIGYMILKEYSNRGIMTNAVRQIINIGFNCLDLLRIEGHVYDKNIASCRVLEKNDFVLEGILKSAIYKNDQAYDLRIYARF